MPSSKIRFASCTVDGIAIADDRKPIYLKRGKSAELSGILISSEWQTDRLLTLWKPRGSEPMTVIARGQGAGSNSVVLHLHIYGCEESEDFGIISTKPVECRLLPEPSKDVEFRVKLTAPAYRGNFVCDIQAFD